MAMKDSKLVKFLKSVGLLSGSGGLAGVILALSGICLPCVLIPLGFVGAGLLFVFSFLSSYRWWLLGGAVVLLLLAFAARRWGVCKIPAKRTDASSRNEPTSAFAKFKAGAAKWAARLNNWKTYVAVPIVLLAIAVLVTLHLAENKSGKLDLTTEEMARPDPYAQLIGDAPTQGPADAKVTVIVYSDFFCPHCLALDEEVIDPILEKYRGKVRFAPVQVNVLMNMGYASTHAAYCAEEQGKYWQMRKVLLERMRPFVGRPKSEALLADMKRASAKGTPEYLARMAGTVGGIDTDRFLSCMKSDKYAARIARATDMFDRLGFGFVPVVLVNGQYFSGYPSAENLSAAIDDALQGNTQQIPD